MGLAIIAVLGATGLLGVITAVTYAASGGLDGEDSGGVLPLVWTLWVAFCGVILVVVLIGEIALRSVVGG